MTSKISRNKMGIFWDWHAVVFVALSQHQVAEEISSKVSR